MTVARLGQAAFRALLRDVPPMNEKLLRGLARRLREADFRDH
jgi:CRP-like cAMP-binding protein